MIVTERVLKRVKAKRDWLWLVYPYRKQENQNKQKPPVATQLCFLRFNIFEQRTNGEAERFDKSDSQVGCKELTRKIRQGIWGRMLSALICSVIYPELLSQILS